MTIAILGLGEAGSHFAHDLSKMGVKIIGFDPAGFRDSEHSRNPKFQFRNRDPLSICSIFALK